MTTNDVQPDDVITSYSKAPARTVTAGGVTYAYRELGPQGRHPRRLLRPPRRHAGQLGPPDHRPDRTATPRHRLRQPRRRSLHRHRPRHRRVDGRRRLCLHHRARFHHRRRPLLLPRRDGRPSAGAQTPRTGPQADPHRNRTRRRSEESTRSPGQPITTRCGQPSPARTPRSSSSSTATTSANAPHAPSSNVSRNAPRTGTRRSA